jgi:hypothetical protein
LFCAAGLLEFRIVPPTGAFMAGRLVTCSRYLGAATGADLQWGPTLRRIWGPPWSIVLQAALLLGLAALPLVPWRRDHQTSTT